MNVNISADGLQLTPSIDSHVRAKLARVLKHFDDIVTVRVLLSLEKTENRADSQCASCNIHVKGADLFAKTSSQDLYATIDELMEKMDGLVRKHKGKAKSHRMPHSGAHAHQAASAA
jgi:putative sigma-54 modulation protein